MKQIRIATILLVLGFGLMQAAAQPGYGRRFDERMQALNARRVAHITERLALNPEEAKVFWPVYNEYLEKLEALSQKHRNLNLQGRLIESMSDAEAANIAEMEVRRMEENAVLRRNYHEKLKEVLPIKKIALLYEAERSFNQSLIRESQHRMRGWR